MGTVELDEVDRGILHQLQRDARNNSASAIAEVVGVAPNTVRSRIRRLEERDVIQGYMPHVDYERAGYQLHVVFVCTATISSRREVADDAFGIEGVVRVTERLSGQRNVIVEAVGQSTDDVTAIGSELEGLGCEIANEWFVKDARVQPFDHFGSDVVEER